MTNTRRRLIGTALSVSLLAGSAGAVAAQAAGTTPDQAGFGQCVSEMGSQPGGLAAYHRDMHGGVRDLGQHLRMIHGDGICMMGE